MRLKAKFKVDGVEQETGCNYRTLRMSACIDESGDNKDWSKWTPNGQLTTAISNEAAFPALDAVKPGDVFYLDITPVPKPE